MSILNADRHSQASGAEARVGHCCSAQTHALLEGISFSPLHCPLTGTKLLENLQSLNGTPLLHRWQAAVGNIEDAKVALDVIARAIDDAVYLDEDAYNQMIPLQQYTRTIEVCAPAPLHLHPSADTC